MARVWHVLKHNRTVKMQQLRSVIV